MTPFGNYIADRTVDCAIQIDPIDFVSTNWQILCEAARLVPAPRLEVNESDPGTLTKRADSPVVLGRTELENDPFSHVLSGTNQTAWLWGVAAGAVRGELVRRNMIHRSQRLDRSRRSRISWAEWPSALAHAYELAIGPNDDSERVTNAADILIIQIGVRRYMRNLSLDEQVDLGKLETIIWSQRDTATVGMFRIEQTEKIERAA